MQFTCSTCVYFVASDRSACHAANELDVHGTDMAAIGILRSSLGTDTVSLVPSCTCWTVISYYSPCDNLSPLSPTYHAKTPKIPFPYWQDQIILESLQNSAYSEIIYL